MRDASEWAKEMAYVSMSDTQLVALIQLDAYRAGMIRAAEIVRAQPVHSDFPADPRTTECLHDKIVAMANRVAKLPD